MTRRILLVLLSGAAWLTGSQTAEARWFRLNHHFSHFRHVRPHVRHWVHRPIHRTGHHVHRLYHHHRHGYPRYGYAYRNYPVWTSAGYWRSGIHWGHRYGWAHRPHWGHRHSVWPRFQVQWGYAPIYSHPRIYYFSDPSCFGYYSQVGGATWEQDRFGLAEARIPSSLRSAWPSSLRSTWPSTDDKAELPGALASGSKIVEFGNVVSSGSPFMTAALRRELPAAESRADSDLEAKPLEQLTGGDRQLKLGDRLFRGRFVAEALAQYDAAARENPADVVPQFRRGCALVALARYREAAEAFRRGLALDASYVDSAFRMRDVYGQNLSFLAGHLEQLAAESLRFEQDADLLYLIGVYLHFDGQAERAVNFFQRAAVVDPRAVDFVQPFLRPVVEPNGSMGRTARGELRVPASVSVARRP